jgi:hypothetical protein
MEIIEDIISWVQTKPKFWQATIDKLIRKNSVSEADIKHISNICLDEYGCKDYEYVEVDFEDLKSIASSSSSTQDVKISSISDVQNINALASGETLSFKLAGLTVVYGDNGSGKSSYTSILKHTCNTRGSKPNITGNLYDTATFNADRLAIVNYSQNGSNPSLIRMTNEELSGNQLKAVNVFDSNSANHFIDGSDEIAFMPQGLAVIEKLSLVLADVQANVQQVLDENSRNKLSASEFNSLVEGTKVKEMFSAINRNTTKDELKELFDWDDTKKSRLAELPEIIATTKATDPQIKIGANSRSLLRYRRLLNKYNSLESEISGDRLEDIKGIFNDYIAKKGAIEEISNGLFSELPLEGVGNSKWRTLWESARIFHNESVEKTTFPKTSHDSSCPLCFQDLDEDAQERFRSFETFVKNDVQQKYDDASLRHKSVVNTLEELDFVLEELSDTVSELDEKIEGFSENHQLYLEQCARQRDELLLLLEQDVVIPALDEKEFSTKPKISLEVLIKTLTEENEALLKTSLAETSAKLQLELDELNGEALLHAKAPLIYREVLRKRNQGKLEKCITKSKTYAVTQKSNELMDAYVGPELKEAFLEELKQLGFKNVKVETKTSGSRGKQYHSLKLDEPNSSSIKLKDILSEGEHRCIALATFLSEVKLASHKSAIVFDDPVSSLDHVWRRKIAARIIEESKERQIIVFTHDIAFMLMLQEVSFIHSMPLEVRNLSRKAKFTGIVSERPPWDALSIKARIGALRQMHVQLEKSYRDLTLDIAQEESKKCYGKLREAWERGIEEVVLNGTVTRFGRGVSSKPLKKVVELTIEDYNTIEENMGKTSGFLDGHDTASALGIDIPDAAEFLEDVLILETYITSKR